MSNTVYIMEHYISLWDYITCYSTIFQSLSQELCSIFLYICAHFAKRLRVFLPFGAHLLITKFPNSTLHLYCTLQSTNTNIALFLYFLIFDIIFYHNFKLIYFLFSRLVSIYFMFIATINAVLFFDIYVFFKFSHSYFSLHTASQYECFF